MLRCPHKRCLTACDRWCAPRHLSAQEVHRIGRSFGFQAFNSSDAEASGGYGREQALDGGYTQVCE